MKILPIRTHSIEHWNKIIASLTEQGLLDEQDLTNIWSDTTHEHTENE